MLKKVIAKMNESIDKTQKLRNRMLIRTAVLWSFAVLAYYAPMSGEMTFSLYMIQIFSILASVVTGAISLVILYVEFFVMSKLETVTAGGKVTSFVIDQARDLAVDTIRDIKSSDKSIKETVMEKAKEKTINKINSVEYKGVDQLKSMVVDEAKVVAVDFVKDFEVQKKERDDKLA